MTEDHIRSPRSGSQWADCEQTMYRECPCWRSPLFSNYAPRSSRGGPVLPAETTDTHWARRAEWSDCAY